MASLSSLITEARNPNSEHIDELSTLEMLTVINQEDATVAAAVASQLPSIARAVDEIAARFASGDSLEAFAGADALLVVHRMENAKAKALGVPKAFSFEVEGEGTSVRLGLTAEGC